MTSRSVWKPRFCFQIAFAELMIREASLRPPENTSHSEGIVNFKSEGGRSTPLPSSVVRARSAAHLQIRGLSGVLFLHFTFVTLTRLQHTYHRTLKIH